MEKTHSLLKRQLKRHFGEKFDIPPEWRGFIGAIGDAYHGFDDDREMLEHSLELSSQELLQANSELRALFQAIPDLLFRLNHEGTILDFKSGATGDLLLAHQEFLGKRIQDIPIQRIGDQFGQAIRQVLEEKTMVNIEYSLTLQGQECLYEARLLPVLESEIVVIIRNITERRELEAKLRQSQKMEAFGQLAAGVAHDFNNILTVILGNLSLSRTGMLSEADKHQAIDHTVQAAERAANLTRQLLTFSRRQPLQPKKLDLNEVVANITKMLQRLIGEDISLEARYAPGGVVIHADTGMMEQLLMNLAVNSRDAMPHGGRLVLQTAIVVIGKEPVQFKPNAKPGEYVCLSVSDTGNGIAPENLPHIFEPFYTTKEVGKGTGLGLATVFGIVEQHGGWIDVESDVNRGTAFHIYLPRLPQRAQVPAESEREPDVRGGSETILLVEDEAAVRKLMHAMLARRGYHVHEADSGVKALPIWQEHRAAIDLLITDMVMPGGLSGRELSDRLQSEKPGLKVIQCSGYTSEAPGQEARLVNNVIFLEKPFSPRKFLQRVRDNLDGRLT